MSFDSTHFSVTFAPVQPEGCCSHLITLIFLLPSSCADGAYFAHVGKVGKTPPGHHEADLLGRMGRRAPVPERESWVPCFERAFVSSSPVPHYYVLSR